MTDQSAEMPDELWIAPDDELRIKTTRTDVVQYRRVDRTPAPGDAERAEALADVLAKADAVADIASDEKSLIEDMDKAISAYRVSRATLRQPAQPDTPAPVGDGVEAALKAVDRLHAYIRGVAGQFISAFDNPNHDLNMIRKALAQRPQTVPDGIIADLIAYAEAGHYISFTKARHLWRCWIDATHYGEGKIFKGAVAIAMLKAAAPQQGGGE